MDISKEAGRILLDCLNLEARTGIDSIGQDTRRKRSLQATLTVAQALTNVHWVGERNSISMSEFETLEHIHIPSTLTLVDRSVPLQLDGCAWPSLLVTGIPHGSS